jgi:hypothetical protein
VAVVAGLLVELASSFATSVLAGSCAIAPVESAIANIKALAELRRNFFIFKKI